ncbi:MAG: hypothetical protein IBJ00_05405 [Alphaproteobacteria bacterium]|nr:hypothetical protein [Alphaproteobacteria bacterium]
MSKCLFYYSACIGIFVMGESALSSRPNSGEDFRAARTNVLLPPPPLRAPPIKQALPLSSTQQPAPTSEPARSVMRQAQNPGILSQAHPPTRRQVPAALTKNVTSTQAAVSEVTELFPLTISGHYLYKMLKAPFHLKGTGGGGVTDSVSINENDLQWGSIRITPTQKDLITSTLENLASGSQTKEQFIATHINAKRVEILQSSYHGSTSEAKKRETGLDVRGALVKYHLMLDNEIIRSSETSLPLEVVVSVSSVPSHD